MNEQLAQISKFLSYVLRHQPESIGISLDAEGWTSISELLSAASKHGKTLDHDLIQTVVANNDKKRFAISEDGLHIRAVQGHSSTKVQIDYLEQIPPTTLYHGTATRFLASIKEKGLLSGERQYVHLSQAPETAIAVGRRHGKAVLLIISALTMHEQGYKFYQAENGVWLTHHVPSIFLNDESKLPI